MLFVIGDYQDIGYNLHDYTDANNLRTIPLLEELVG